MELIKSTLVHKIVEPSLDHTGPHPTVILLHGRGTNEDDLLGLAPYLDPRLLIISARAPFQFPFGGYAWYEIFEVGTPHPQQFDESYRRLVEFVDDAKRAYPIDSSKLFLLGFSMGSIMSFALSLSKPDMVTGIVAHSGYIPENTSLQFQWDNLAHLSAFVAHGIYDPVIPIQFGRRANELLSKTRAEFTYKEYPIPHTISEESLSDLSAWLQKRVVMVPPGT